MKRISALFLASLLLSTHIGLASDRDDMDRDSENQDPNQMDERQSGPSPEETKSALLRKKTEIEQAIRTIVAADAQTSAKEKELRQTIKTAQQALSSYQLEAEKRKKDLIAHMNTLKSQEAAAAKADADAQTLALQKINQDFHKKKLQLAHEEMQIKKELKEITARMQKLIPSNLDTPHSNSSKSHGKTHSTLSGIPNDPTTQLSGIISQGHQIVGN